MFSGLSVDQLGFYTFIQPSRGIFNSYVWRVKSIISIKALRIFALNIPGTYPAWEINGEMLTGILSPELSCFPKELELEYKRNWIVEGRNLNQIFEAFNMKKDLFLRKMDDDFDLMIYVIRVPDAISHKFIALGGKHLELSPTLGDVLINKTFFSLVRYAKKKGVYIRMFTNGILLKKNENFKEVINSGIDDIVISTGDLIPKYEAEILGISQELASQKIEGLLKLLEYKEKTKSNIKITIGFRPKRSFKEIWNTIKNSEFKRFFDKRIFKIDYAFRYDNWCGKISKKDLLGVMRLRRRPILRKYPCSSLWNVSVLANGDLRLCGCRVKETEHDELVIGNVLTESLSEIINNKKGQKILSDWMVGEIIETCEDCRRYGFPKYFKKFK